MRGDFEDVRSWANSPKDILALILSRLCAGDAAAFYMVCKSWSEVKPQVGIERILSDEELCTCPCLIFPNGHFFHPLYNTRFQMNNMPVMPKGVILEQNYGWILLKLGENHPFFYNPFTGIRIDMPVSPIGRIAFSAPPTSPECEIVRFQNLIRDQIVVHTIKRGEEDFYCENLCRSKAFSCSSKSKTVFFQGKYYCMGKDGNLAIYNPKKKNKCYITKAPLNLWEHFNTTDCGRYLFEGDDDLWAVFVAFQGREICVLKLNLSDMRWERVYDLGDRMVFLSYQSCMMEKATVKGAGNKIYFTKLMGENCMFYSLATKRFHTFEKGSTYESLRGSKDMPRCTWIKMNVNELPSQTCFGNFIW